MSCATKPARNCIVRPKFGLDARACDFPFICLTLPCIYSTEGLIGLHFKTFWFFFVWPIFAAFQAFADDAAWKVPNAAFACIVDNAKIYQDTDANPLVIVVQSCLEADPQKALANAVENTGTFAVGQGDSVIILTQTELRCLVEKAPGLRNSDPVLVPRSGLCN